MSNNDYILNLLNIEDKNIFILNNCIEKRKIGKYDYKIIEAILTYKPKCCPNCGVINESSNDIIKWGFKRNCKVKIPLVSNCKTLLLLHKQRFYCKHCNDTFTAETSLVDKFKNISNNSNLLIKTELMKKQSEKDIAERAGVSTTKVNNVLSSLVNNKVLRHPTLPEKMNWDEFKATKDTKGKMAFIITDNDKGTIFDINDSRKSIDLEKYFKRYSNKQRKKVKFISTDFYTGYIYLAEKLFKNAKIVIDRFHIVEQIYNALNITRVKLCNKSNLNRNKLKHYWKLIVKNKNDLSEEKQYSNYFKKEISQQEIVTYLINTDKTLKANYECYQGLINSIKDRNFDKFKKIIYNHNNLYSDKMNKALNLYKRNIKYIENSFKYDINNGIIEGKNNLIKSIKRIAFGYRKYDNFVTRIFLISGIVKE